MTSIPRSNYSFIEQGQTHGVHSARLAEAAQIDSNQDGNLCDEEIGAYLERTDSMHDHGGHKIDKEQLLGEFKHHLRKEMNPNAAAYPTYDQMSEQLSQLERTYPNLAEKVSLGKTHEGRDIWALKISKGARCEDTSSKTGIVLTGCHHAREWMSVMPPLRTANDLLAGYASNPDMKRRVDQGEIWVVPIVNPDGYEYSRSEDNWWRKNRGPVGQDACGQATDAIGTDLNRNYDTAKDPTLYRPEGDTPCSTSDDFGWATSDEPHSDTFRGSSGANQPEVQALLELELGRGNIKGVLDHHGYGEMILMPWGFKNEPAPGIERLRDVGNRMNQAIDESEPFRVMPSIDLYGTSGTSTDILYANGVFAYTLEIGRSFQPPVSQIEPIASSVSRANMVFIDDVLANGGAPPPQA